MLLPLLLLAAGIAVFVWNPSWGLVPSFLLITLALVLGILSLFGQGPSAIPYVGSTKACPNCRLRLSSTAVVCTKCGYRYAQS